MNARHGMINLGELTGDSAVPQRRTALIPQSNAAANQLSETFDYQSYFDSTLLEKAVLEQAPNNPIVQSTRIDQQLSGYAIGNHPDSQTPVAVVFSGDGLQSGSSSHIIPPGAVIRPAGGEFTKQHGFQSFSWGLPFGWLGGGTATIVVLQTPEAAAQWNPRPLVLFHRFRAIIYAPAGLPAAGSLASSWPRNWPTRFPNLLTRRSTAPTINQSGAPQIAISKPGHVTLRLRTTVGTASQMKAVFYRTTDFSDELTAQTVPIELDSVEFAVPARTPYVYTAGYTEFTLFEGHPILASLGCNGRSTNTASMTGGVVFVSDDPQLQGQYIDVARYGYL